MLSMEEVVLQVSSAWPHEVWHLPIPITGIPMSISRV